MPTTATTYDISIVLKTRKQIEATLEESELEDEAGMKLADGIEWENSKFNKSGYTLQKLDDEYGTKDVLVNELNAAGEPIWISMQWVREFKVKGKSYKVTEEFIKGTRFFDLQDGKFFDLQTMTIKDSLPLCKCCETTVIEASGQEICPTCVDKLVEKKSYSYRPEYNFIGSQIAADEANPIWYGLELEYGLNKKYELAEMMLKHKDSIFLKSDASIQGGSFRVEMVSHPHSFNYLMGKESFIKDVVKLDVDQQESSNGCHIHISRTSFIDDKHFGLFYFLVGESQELAEYIGNRKETGYCRFSTDGVVATKENKALPNAKRKAVNESNAETVEIRFFNSSNKVEEVNNYVQFLDSMIKYTKYAKKSVSLKGWLAYAKKYGKKYADVVRKMESYEGTLTTNVKYKQPKKSEKPFSRLTIADLGFISEIHKKQSGDSVKEYKITGTNARIVDGGTAIEADTACNGWTRIESNDIVKIVLVK